MVAVLYLSPKEYAELLRIHPNTVRRAVHRGELRAVRVGTAIRIPLPPSVPA